MLDKLWNKLFQTPQLPVSLFSRIRSFLKVKKYKFFLVEGSDLYFLHVEVSCIKMRLRL